MKVNVLKKDFFLKMVSLIIAAIVWVYIMGDLGYDLGLLIGKNEEAQTFLKDVPIYVMYDSSKIQKNVKVEPIKINILLKGKTDILNELDVKDILAYVDITGFAKGTYFLIVKLIMPQGVQSLDEVKTVKVEIVEGWGPAKDNYDIEIKV